MERKTLYAGMAIIMLLVGIAASSMFVNRKPALRGETIDPPLPAADFNMVDANGAPFQLSAERGKVVLLYFGFVNCPEECPLTMAHFKVALETLGDSAARDVQVVLVSTDPVRDTPQAMKEYLANFNPTFIGIPGTPAQLETIWKDFGVTVLEGGETHSSYTYVIDRRGMLRLNFTPDTTSEDIVYNLKILLAE